MKIILTVTGIDHEGIIAAVTATLAEQGQRPRRLPDHHG